jgi:hypothetical protein
LVAFAFGLALSVSTAGAQETQAAPQCNVQASQATIADATGDTINLGGQDGGGAGRFDIFFLGGAAKTQNLRILGGDASNNFHIDGFYVDSAVSEFTGEVRATRFVGDGSGLTGISGSGGTGGAASFSSVNVKDAEGDSIKINSQHGAPNRFDFLVPQADDNILFLSNIGPDFKFNDFRINAKTASVSDIFGADVMRANTYGGHPGGAPAKFIGDGSGLTNIPKPTIKEVFKDNLNPASKANFIFASCPAGTAVTGGGCYTNDATFNLVYSANEGDGWVCRWNKEADGTQGQQIATSALCLG